MELRGHLLQIMTHRQIFREFFLGNFLLDLVAARLDAADVAIDDAAVIFLAQQLVALRMAERVLQLEELNRTWGHTDRFLTEEQLAKMNGIAVPESHQNF